MDSLTYSELFVDMLAMKTNGLIHLISAMIHLTWSSRKF